MGLVTLQEYKIYSQKAKSNTNDDERINVIIEQISDMVESYCGRKFALADYEEYHDGGDSSVFVENFPITKLASVEEFNGEDYVLLGNPDPVTGSFITTVGSAHTLTAQGDANVSTRTSKFNSSSCKLDGVGDYITIADSSDFYFDTEGFSIDAQVNFSNTSSIHTIVSHGTDSNNYWSLELDFLNSKGLTFRVVESGSETFSIAEQNSANYSVGSFYHTVISREGSNFKIFSNGREANTVSSSISIPNFTGNFEIGRNSGTENNLLRGYLDELRVSWVPRYTADFTAPTIQHPTDKDTKLLVHFDGGFTDDSRNVNDYTIDNDIGKIDRDTFQSQRTLSNLGYVTFNNYPHAVKVNYTAGYSSVPDDLKNAVLELTKMYFKGFEGVNSISLQGESFTRSTPMKDGFPPHIRRVLNLYKVY